MDRESQQGFQTWDFSILIYSKWIFLRGKCNLFVTQESPILFKTDFISIFFYIDLKNNCSKNKIKTLREHIPGRNSGYRQLYGKQTNKGKCTHWTIFFFFTCLVVAVVLSQNNEVMRQTQETSIRYLRLDKTALYIYYS